jgi:hypothetical protein
MTFADWDINVAGQQGQASGVVGPVGPQGAGFLATSSTNLVLGPGPKTFQTQSGLAYLLGTRVRMTSQGTPSQWMEGNVTAYSGTSMSVNVDLTDVTLGATATYANFIGGLTLSNDPTTPNTVLDIAIGSATSDDNHLLIPQVQSNYTKNCNAAWNFGSAQGALDVGTALGASRWYHVYLILRGDTNAVDLLLSQAPSVGPTSVAATSATPAVFTWAGGTVGLPVQNGAQIVLGGTTVPTGFTAGVTYFVVGASPAAGTFNLAATQGGAAMASTSTGTAVTATSNPTLPASYTQKRRIGSIRTDASSHILPFTQVSDEFIWTAAQTEVSSGTAVGASVAVQTFNAQFLPLGISTLAWVDVQYTQTSPGHFGVGSPFSPLSNSFYTQTVQPAGGVTASTQVRARTNTSAQLVYQQSVASGNWGLFALGWIDNRGR